MRSYDPINLTRNTRGVRGHEDAPGYTVESHFPPPKDTARANRIKRAGGTVLAEQCWHVYLYNILYFENGNTMRYVYVFYPYYFFFYFETVIKSILKNKLFLK